MTQNQLQEYSELPIEINGHVWYDDSDNAEIEEYPLTEYDIVSSPNDFNVKTIKEIVKALFFVDTFPHKVHEYTERIAAQA